ncbi:hypothetical protein [Lachnoclostridium phytofermentans]|uniref:hypothetical protein n=1 Tax=Lachnoclostridium phytofermentans TaxID=66219 RepID=UPI0012FCF6CA|nr:hypothetical protein [Lachnoclostridium phytofermentans]
MSKQYQQRYVKEREKQLQGTNKSENCSNSTSNDSNLSDCSNTTQKQATKNNTNK